MDVLHVFVCVECGNAEMTGVVSRLREWITVLHESGNPSKKYKFQKPERSEYTHTQHNIKTANITANLIKLTMDFMTKKKKEKKEIKLLSTTSLSVCLEVDMSKVPLCKDSLGWMFSRLDTNFDLQLDQSELSSLSSEKSDVCTKAFLRSCDPDRDRLVSSQEWCSCFQRYQGTVNLL